MNLSSILDKAGKISDAVGTIADIGGIIGNIGALFSPDYWKAKTGSGLTGAQKESMQWEAQQAEQAFSREADYGREMFARQTELENTSYQRRVADMQAAGLNPMLALGAGGAGSASIISASHAAPSGPAAQPVANLGELLSLSLLPLQKKSLRADIKVKEAEAAAKNADAEKKTEDTRGSKLQNDYFEEVRDLRKEGERLSNELTKAQWKSVWKQIDLMQSDITRNIEQAHTEQEKQKLYIQQAILAGEQADNIVKMRPFVQLAMAAQTDKDSALARVAAVDEAYRQGLIDEGAIKAAVRLDNAKASESEINAKAKAFTQSIKDGSLRKAADSAGDWRTAVSAGLYEALSMASSALQGKL